MILTITPNPSLDLLFDAERALVWDDANRVDAPRIRAGGQGINLTRAARALGFASTAIAWLGGRTGDELETRLAAEGTPLVRVPIGGETRTFVAVHERPARRTLLVNPRGPRVAPREVDALLEAAAIALRILRPRWVVGSGSTPPGCPHDLFALLGMLARGSGSRFIADTDGEPMQAAVEAGVCDILVPNRHEARRLTGIDPTDEATATAVAEELLARAPLVVLKLGSEGAVAVGQGRPVFARAPRQEGIMVGAGDAFLAAFLAGCEQDLPTGAALARAVAAGASVARSRGADLVDRDSLPGLLDAVELRLPDG